MGSNYDTQPGRSRRNVFAPFEKQEIEIAFNEMRQVITQVSQMLDEV
jgi:hypothetical protein